MKGQLPQDFSDLILPLVIWAVACGWYVVQVALRRRKHFSYMLRKAGVCLFVYTCAAVCFSLFSVPPLLSLTLFALAGVGCAELLVPRPKRSRKIPAAIRKRVIARDLTSKGLKWDSRKYHIDHIVPHSKKGDHSMQNLRVIETKKNLAKGQKMPGVSDLIQ